MHRVERTPLHSRTASARIAVQDRSIAERGCTEMGFGVELVLDLATTTEAELFQTRVELHEGS